jgi:ParB family chromosome partitioning protein
MSERQRGLGRGLSALLGDAGDAFTASEGAAPDAPVSGAQEAPIELLHRNPDQPRKVFAEAEIDELAASIREKGLLQPILVRPSFTPGEYQIVAGERRWRAAQKAGLRTVPIIVRRLDDLEVLEIAVIENVQRADLNAIEEAYAYEALMLRFGRTQDAVAQAVGKSRSHVANTLRLLQLPTPVRDHVLAGRLSAGHARAIASAPNVEELAERVIAGGMSVRQAEALGREALNRAAREPRPSVSGRTSSGSGGKTADVHALEADLAESLGLDVELDDRGGKGTLMLRYGSLEQLDDLCRRLMRSPVGA